MTEVVNEWKFRILEQEYDDYPSKYILETDQGSNGENWVSVYRNTDLEKVREIRKEREAQRTRKPPKVIE